MNDYPDSWTCFNCGETGHLAAACPAQAATPPRRTYDNKIPPRRPEHEIADARAWADAIRHDMGWPRTTYDPATGQLPEDVPQTVDMAVENLHFGYS